MRLALDFEPSKASFEELSTIVSSIQGDWHYNSVFAMIDNNPLTRASIDDILEDGWKVEFTPLPFQLAGIDWKLKLIKIEKQYQSPKTRIDCYVRDVTLFHEVIHIHYEKHGDMLADATFFDITQERRVNGAIVEWLARKSRANSKLLKKAVKGFGFTPLQYDIASLEAFKPYTDIRQETLPFKEKETTTATIPNFNNTLMEGY
ncbi:hypothetical protein GOV04_01480 [Candidatus Woesearchaeota archaeon]|nr:hypothetical protein [Candidatus Woesearchaeota archaeon]